MKKMKKTLFVFTVLVALISSGVAFAADKVVVVPLNSSAALNSSWTNAGIVWTAPFSTDGLYPSTLQYKKIGNLVFLKGFANAVAPNLTKGQIIATLPEGYRPPAGFVPRFICPTWGWPSAVPAGYSGTAHVSIDSSGVITVREVYQYDTEQQFLYFDSLFFSVD